MKCLVCIISITEELLQKDKKKKEEPSSMFQRQRVDVLLAELARKFPIKYTPVPTMEKSGETFYSIHAALNVGSLHDWVLLIFTADDNPKVDVKVEVKTEKSDDHSSVSSQVGSIKPPPEKKAKLLRWCSSLWYSFYNMYICIYWIWDVLCLKYGCLCVSFIAVHWSVCCCV